MRGIFFFFHYTKYLFFFFSGTCKASGAIALKNQSACSCKKNDECCMLLCRITLGEALEEVTHRGNQPVSLLYIYILCFRKVKKILIYSFFFFFFPLRVNIGTTVVRSLKKLATKAFTIQLLEKPLVTTVEPL